MTKYKTKHDRKQFLHAGVKFSLAPLVGALGALTFLSEQMMAAHRPYRARLVEVGAFITVESPSELLISVCPA